MFSPPPPPPLHSASGFTFFFIIILFLSLSVSVLEHLCVFSGSSPSFILPLFMFHRRPLILDHPPLLSDLPVDSHTAWTEEQLSARGMRKPG